MKEETISSREFNQDLARAKRAAQKSPVIITDRGRPAHVLLSFTEYRRLTQRKHSLGELLRCDSSAEIELPIEPPQGEGEWARVPDLEG